MKLNNKHPFLAITIALSAASMSAWAAPDKYDAIYDKCVTDVGTMNNSVVHGCSTAVYDADKKSRN